MLSPAVLILPFNGRPSWGRRSNYRLRHRKERQTRDRNGRAGSRIANVHPCWSFAPRQVQRILATTRQQNVLVPSVHRGTYPCCMGGKGLGTAEDQTLL